LQSYWGNYPNQVTIIATVASGGVARENAMLVQTNAGKIILRAEL